MFLPLTKIGINVFFMKKKCHEVDKLSEVWVFTVPPRGNISCCEVGNKYEKEKRKKGNVKEKEEKTKEKADRS